MPYKTIQPIEGLEGLKFLSEIHNQKDYNQQVDGPYLVARIIDHKRFGEEFSSMHCGNDYEKQFIEDVHQLDAELGWSCNIAEMNGEWSIDTPVKGMAQNRYTSHWHQDEHKENLELAWPDFCRFYAAASTDGTLYIKESVTRTKPKWFRPPHDENDVISISPRLTEAVRSKGVLMKCEDYGLYLFPIGVWHCAPISPDGAPRTFCRITVLTS
jgi:hypothetical protein